jgi:hypothetical protein
MQREKNGRFKKSDDGTFQNDSWIAKWGVFLFFGILLCILLIMSILIILILFFNSNLPNYLLKILFQQAGPSSQEAASPAAQKNQAL